MCCLILAECVVVGEESTTTNALGEWLPTTSSLRRIWGGVVVIGQGVVVVARPIGFSDGDNKVMVNSPILNLPERSRSFNTSCDF